MKKPRKPWRLLGFCDLHLFRSQTLVAGVGFFIALPSRIVVCCRLRTLGSAHSLLGGVSFEKRTHCVLFSALTHSLRRREAAAGGRGGKSRPAIGKRKDHPTGWSFLLLVAGVGFEPHDLRVMSPTSYQAALLRDILLSSHSHCLL